MKKEFLDTQKFFGQIISDYKEDRLERLIHIYFNLLFDIALTRFKYRIIDKGVYSEYFLNQLFLEVEKRLILAGVCAVIDKKDTGKTVPIAAYAYGYGVTWYFDFFDNFNWFSPVDSGYCKDEKNIDIEYQYSEDVKEKGLVGYNDSTHDGLFEFIYHYAETIAHLTLSIQCVSINMREPSSIPTVSTNRLAYVINNFKKKIFKGDFMPVEDLGLSTVKWVDNKGVTNNTLSELVETRKKMLLEFYNLLGVKTGYEKKGNVVTEELNANEEMLRLNFDDMLKHRGMFVDMINEKYGIKVEVYIKGGERDV